MLTYLYEWDSGIAIHRRLYTFSEKECDDMLKNPNGINLIVVYCSLTEREYVLGLPSLKNIILKGIKL